MSIYLLLSGLALMVAMQFIIFFVALKNSMGHALLCLFVPFYVYVYGKKEPQAKPFPLGWYAGVVLLVVGVMASA